MSCTGIIGGPGCGGSCCVPNPMSYPGSLTPGTPVAGPSLYDEFMSDTVGLVYRSFSALPKVVGGSGAPKVDPWTLQILQDQQAAALVQAGMDPSQAAIQASTDVTNTVATAPSLQPCACNSISWTTWLVVGIVGLIVIVVIANAFGSKLASDV